MENLFTNPKPAALTVLELNSLVRGLIRDAFPQPVWVCGEIQNLRPERSKKHLYFELVQKDPASDNIQARVQANLFAGKIPLIEQRIKEAPGAFELTNDIEVKFLCDIDLYPPNGKYSINIIDIDPVYTLGKVAQNRLRIIEELRVKGLLEKNRLTTSIPLLPLRIGLITALDSAAYHDFINELSLSGFGFLVMVYNCHMQGKSVERDVAAALQYFSGFSQEELDAVVITRGGGSTADLSYFDNRKIAEAVAAVGFPVIAALGHQIDTTITDLVAHTSVKTPTKAAQFLVERVSQVFEQLSSFQERILRQASDALVAARTGLKHLSVRMESASSRYFRDHREELLNKKHAVMSALKVALTREAQMHRRLIENIHMYLEKFFARAGDRLQYLQEKINILDPKNVLRRGYSITIKGGKTVKSVDELTPGDEISTVLYKGEVFSTVTRKEVDDE